MSPADRLASKKPMRKPRPDVSPVLVCCARRLRLGKSLSLRDVCKATGLSAPTLSRVERGDMVTLPNAIRLAKFFGVKIGDLWPAAK